MGCCGSEQCQTNGEVGRLYRGWAADHAARADSKRDAEPHAVF